MKSEQTSTALAKKEAPPSVFKELASMSLVVVGLGLLGYAFIRHLLSTGHAETPLIVDVKMTTGTKVEQCGPVAPDGRPTPIEMIYSDDKQDWIEDAAQSFSRLCPNIQVKLRAMGDIESADAIVAGAEKPTLWAPADDLVVQYLDARWKKEQPDKKPLFDATQQTSLAASPMVVIMWRNRFDVANRILSSRPVEYGPWVTVTCAQVPLDPNLDGVAMSDMVPGTWIDWYNPVKPPREPEKKPARGAKPANPPPPAVEDMQAIYQAPFPTLEQIASWGRVKLGHTSPSRSAAGLGAIYLMAFEYLRPQSQLTPESLKAFHNATNDVHNRGQVVSLSLEGQAFRQALAEKKDPFGRWLRRCEAGLDGAPKSARLLTDAFFHVGEKRYDAVVTYEHLALEVLRRTDGHGSAVATVQVLYPEPTLMNQHPAVVMDAEHLSDSQKISAQKWLNYLRTEEIQKRAIEYGFRPVNSAVSIRDYNSERNQFVKYRRYGVNIERAILEPPRLDGQTVFDLVRLWEDATGRN